MKLKQLAANCTEVELTKNHRLFFSYETCVGFEAYGVTVLSENVWSRTTGKHLNMFGDKADRVPYEEFQAKLDSLMKGLVNADA